MAIDLALKLSLKNVAFLATCVPRDDEMKRRVLLHKKNRPHCWKTIEIKQDLLKALKDIKKDFKVVIIDCLTLFVSGLLIKGEGERVIRKKLTGVLDFISKAPFTSIIVSNEVGAGVVPENKLARDFIDLSGISNQISAKYANEAYLVVAGIPMKIK